MAAFRRLFPQIGLRVSDYTIPIAARNAQRWILAHGYTGAIDEVDEHVFTWIESGLAGDAPDTKTAAHLARRGYLTQKTPDEERTHLAGVVERLRGQTRDEDVAFTVILSYDCNFRCTYCTQRPVQTKGQEFLDAAMSDEVMDAAFRHMEKLGAGDITLYGGEPFMLSNAHRVRRFLGWARERDIQVRCVSNGHDWRAFEDVFDPAVIGSIQVTLDGPPAVHDERRVGVGRTKTFHKILDNVAWALERGITISARVNTDRRNVEALLELTEIVQSRGLYEHNFSLYLAAVQDNAVMNTDPLFERGEMFHRLLDAHARACDGSEPGSVPFNTEYLPDLRHSIHRCLEEKRPLPYRVAYCSAYTNMQVLDPHGRIFACWDFADDDANAIGRFHPRLESFAPAIQRWRGRIDEMLVGDCLSCPYVLLHGTGCQSAAFNREGEFWVRDCQDFPEEFELAVQGAVGDLRVRGRTPKYESAAAEQERRASEREARIPAPTSLPHAE